MCHRGQSYLLYINNIDQNVNNTNFHYYADDTVIYNSASTPNLALSQLQLAFNIVQRNLFDLKLVLNADKTKSMLFSKSKSIPHKSSFFLKKRKRLNLCLSISISEF